MTGRRTCRSTLFNRSQFLQEGVTSADGFRRGHVDEGKSLDVTEPESL